MISAAKLPALAAPFFVRGGKIFSLFFQPWLYADVLCVICSVFFFGVMLKYISSV